MAEQQQPSQDKIKIGILIADTDKATRAFFNTALTKAEDFTVWTAATCQEALETLESIKAEQLSVMVFDLTQEGLDGHVLLQKVRNDIKYNKVGILICSDSLSRDDRFLLQEMDIKHFLGKSIGTADFISKIREIDTEMKAKAPVLDKIRELELALRVHDTVKCNELISSTELTKDGMPEIVPLKAEVMLANQEVEPAIDLLKNFLQTEAKSGRPETFRALSTFGRALCTANKFDEALGIFQRLAEKSPNNLAHKINLGDTLLGKGDVEGAQKQFQQVLDKDPSNTEAMVGMGGATLAGGNTEGAISLFSRIKGPIESYSLASYFNNAAIALTRQGKSFDAIALYTNAIQFFDKYKPLIYFNMGMAHLRNGKVDNACECFDYVIKLDKTGFVEKKAILREYRDLGSEHMLNKYKNPETHK